MRQLAALGREAAEILWEMAAMQDSGDAAKEMLDKTAQLQARLLLPCPSSTALMAWNRVSVVVLNRVFAVAQFFAAPSRKSPETDGS